MSLMGWLTVTYFKKPQLSKYNSVFIEVLNRDQSSINPCQTVTHFTANHHYHITGVCTNATAPSVSSINRILRNRAAERAAAEFARAAGYGLYHPHPYAAFPWHPAHLWSAPTLGLAPGSSASSSAAAAAMAAGASPASSASPTSIGHQHDVSGISTSDLMMPRLIGQCYFCVALSLIKTCLTNSVHFFINLFNKCF